MRAVVLSRTYFAKRVAWCSNQQSRYTRRPRDVIQHRKILANAANGQLNDLHAAPRNAENEASGEALNEFIGPGLQLMRQDIEIDGLPFSLIVPESSDAVIDFYIDSGRLERDPYWCRLWPSALALAKLLLGRPDLVRRKYVCEIGAGLGIGGMAAARAGAESVLLTDREDLALDCALRSCEASGLSATNSSSEPTSPNTAQVIACNLDWTAVDPKIGRFDIVLACDVIYEHAAVSAVADLVPKLLPSTGGRFILADPETRTPKHREELIDILTKQKSCPMSLEIQESMQISMDGTETAVQLLVFSSLEDNTTIGVKL